MTVHRIKLKDLNEKFVQQLKDQLQNDEVEVEIRVSTDQGDCADREMNEDLFWEVIALFNWEEEDNDSAVLEPAIAFLSQCSINNIKAFHNILSEKLFLLDGLSYASNIGSNKYTEDGFFSVDLFLYARCCVVANGRAFYEQVLKHPEEMPKDLTFEALLNLPALAFERKTGFEMEHVPSHNYETFFNAKGWHSTSPRII